MRETEIEALATTWQRCKITQHSQITMPWWATEHTVDGKMWGEGLKRLLRESGTCAGTWKIKGNGQAVKHMPGKGTAVLRRESTPTQWENTGIKTGWISEAAGDEADKKFRASLWRLGRPCFAFSAKRRNLSRKLACFEESSQVAQWRTERLNVVSWPGQSR